MARSVKVFYRQADDGAWIATSPDVPGYVGHGSTFAEARGRIEDGLSWFAERDLFVVHVRPGGNIEASGTTGSEISFSLTKMGKPPKGDLGYEFVQRPEPVKA